MGQVEKIAADVLGRGHLLQCHHLNVSYESAVLGKEIEPLLGKVLPGIVSCFAAGRTMSHVWVATMKPSTSSSAASLPLLAAARPDSVNGSSTWVLKRNRGPTPSAQSPCRHSWRISSMFLWRESFPATPFAPRRLFRASFFRRGWRGFGILGQQDPRRERPALVEHLLRRGKALDRLGGGEG